MTIKLSDLIKCYNPYISGYQVKEVKASEYGDIIYINLIIEGSPFYLKGWSEDGQGGLELDEQQRVIQLPARFVYEMATDKYTDEVKEKVIYGEINDFDEFKSYSVKTPFVKKTKHKEIKKEAVIDELLEIKLKLEELMDKFSKGDCSFEELSSLKKINKLIDKI